MLTTMKAYACYAVKIYSNKQTKINKTGSRGRSGLDPPLIHVRCHTDDILSFNYKEKKILR